MNEDCFARTKKAGKDMCYSLKEMDCEKCHFYKSRNEITIQEIEKQLLDKEFKTKGVRGNEY